MSRISLVLLHVFLVLLLDMKSALGDAQVRCIDEEREALLKFKEGVIDDSGFLSSWGNEEDNKDCCRWKGVWCSDKSGHVTELDLACYELANCFPLRGNINPSFLRNLSSLQALDISNNDLNIEGNLEWLPHISSLESLHLSGLNLSEANDWGQAVLKLPNLRDLALHKCNLPDITLPYFSLVNSSSLANLDLSGNSLTSSIYQWLFNFSGSLELLDLSSNQIESGFPDLKHFSSLKYLILSYNRLNSTIPESIGNLSNLVALVVPGSYLKGVISEAHFSKLSKLNYLDFSFNSLVLNFHYDWNPPFQLSTIGLASCKLGPHFPKWLQTQYSVEKLDISAAGIQDSIPDWFWNQRLGHIVRNLSCNKINGRIANMSLEFTGLVVDLSSNQIEGPIPQFLLNAGLLILSKNKFSGTISFLCGSSDSLMSFLDLSDNQLSGELPDCWPNWEYLQILNLANNNFSGKIPKSIGFLLMLQSLHLRNNSFTGELPSSLQNLTWFKTIDLGDNKLSGPIPTWVGDRLSNLIILSLRSNQFSGSLPLNLCHLVHIQLLDLSSNNFSGSIPKCINNLAAMVEKRSSSPIIILSTKKLVWHRSFDDEYPENAVLVWKGREFEYQKTLGLLKSIDLSRNKLTGEIPEEITDLVALVSLNLSRNNLTGHITSKIGQLDSLDFLDLSGNHLFGEIPSSLSQLDRLSVLDLSNNNLSGEIPTGTQLQSFNPSTYSGNIGLCGAPLPNKCQRESPIPGGRENDNGQEHQDRFITRGFYFSMVFGFIFGFWGICGSLVLNNSWRYAYFKFLDVVKDRLYVAIIVRLAELQRRHCN